MDERGVMSTKHFILSETKKPNNTLNDNNMKSLVVVGNIEGYSSITGSHVTEIYKEDRILIA